MALLEKLVGPDEMLNAFTESIETLGEDTAERIGFDMRHSTPQTRDL